MKKLSLLLLFCSISFLGISQHDDSMSEGPFSQLIIRGATLINGTGAPPRGPVDIVIEKNRITQIKVVGYPGVPILSLIHI